MKNKSLLTAIVLLLFSAPIFASCGYNASKEGGSSVEISIPAEVPENVEGFGGLEWGDSYEALVGPYVEIVQRGITFAGCGGIAYYTFDKNGELSRGFQHFNQNLTLTWGEAAEAYFAMRNVRDAG